MKLFIVELIYDREIRIKADKHVKEGDRFVFYSDAGTRVDDILCEIVRTIREDAIPAPLAPAGGCTTSTVPAAVAGEVTTSGRGAESKDSITCEEFRKSMRIYTQARSAMQTLGMEDMRDKMDRHRKECLDCAGAYSNLRYQLRKEQDRSDPLYRFLGI